MRIALAFLTRFPTGRVVTDDPMRDLGRAAGLFPLVGLLVGAAGLVAYLAGRALFGPAVAAVAAAGAGLWASGALHLDGLMDTADGVLSGRDRERMLEIMKDSRVGAMGVTAGALALLLRVALLLELDPGRAAPALLVAPALGRMVMPLAAVQWPPARSWGLGSAYVRHVGRPQAAAALLSGLALALALPAAAVELQRVLAAAALELTLPHGLAAAAPSGALTAALRGLGAWVAALGVCFGCGGWLARRLGGQTGDTYGALCELAELAALACFGVAAGEVG
ncbi:adenosylcobinamide-GDP ribazoletransferase [Symbiobacterium terraclitae]|uniref:adenosylcobinamide-GDP ribazoletransferase n=1 Tax=Symbiobacterium terraclitae TaxID=557451 RepID=UPI0035B537D0